MLQLEQIRRNLRQILKLTLPITTSFVAMGIMGIVDTMIVGNYQTDNWLYRFGQLGVRRLVHYSDWFAAGRAD